MPRMSKKSKTSKMSGKSLRGGARKSKGSRNSKKSTKGAKSAHVPVGGVVGYCLICRQSHEMSDVKYVTAKNGAKMAKGKCPRKGNGMAKILARK